MKYIPHTGKIIVACATAIALFGIAQLVATQSVQPAAEQIGGGMMLQPPAFLKSARAADDPEQVEFSLVVEEAGVTAYAKLDQEIDLGALESRFKTIRQQTDLFISGIVTAPGYEDLSELDEIAEVQVFLHHDGWIIAYLTRWQPASALVDWVNYDEQRLTSTLIENVVRTLALDVGVPGATIAYYDFRYPEATNLVLAADRADVSTGGDSFEITIPRKLTVYETSWAHAKFSGSYYASSCSLDGEELSAVNPGAEIWGFTTGEFAQADFSPDTTHTLALSMNWYHSGANRIYCGIAVVYREAA
jgi:hypothetical protein